MVSNASCTTNCLAPVAKVIHETFGIIVGTMTTIHSYTNDQNLLDLPHKDLRRARAAALSMIPTSTGAAKAMQSGDSRVEGQARRLFAARSDAERERGGFDGDDGKARDSGKRNAALKSAADGPMKGILDYTDEELVSVDFRGNPRSAIVDSGYTRVVGGNCVKVLAWYDNEWGYSCRCRDLIRIFAARLWKSGPVLGVYERFVRVCHFGGCRTRTPHDSRHEQTFHSRS